MSGRGLPIVLLALALTSASFAACGTTSGRAIALTFTAQGEGADFDTASGWQVHLTAARMVMGPIYVLAPAAGSRLAVLHELLLPVAHAHGGVDETALHGARAECLVRASIDLLAPTPTVIGLGDGTAGATELATIVLAPPDASDTSGLTHGHAAWIAGTATRGAETIAFEGGLDLPDAPLDREVEQVEAGGTLERDGTFAITVHLGGRRDPSSGARLAPSWLEEADFETLPVPASGGVRTIAAGTQPHDAWFLAARDAAAFTTAFTPEAP